jgi:molybdopterin molybdotransferase
MVKTSLKGFSWPFFGSKQLQNILSRFSPLETEAIPLSAGLGRVLADSDMPAGENLPAFARSTMDGFAVRTEDTLNCTESEPILLNIIGETITGSPGTAYTLNSNQAVKIWTGGKLPAKSDGVVMVERTRMLDDTTVEIFRPLVTGENIVRAGEDFTPGTIIFPANKTGERKRNLRPIDLGVLAGLGKTELKVHRRVKVGIISTGDELVPPDQHSIESGKIRDINATTLSGLIQEAGAVPTSYAIVKDNPEQILDTCEQVLQERDILIISGGSSDGKRDFTRQVFENIKGCQLLHGGKNGGKRKPTLLAIKGKQAILGLPGHPASIVIIFYLFVRPLIRKLSGLPPNIGLPEIAATISQPISSTPGQKEFIRVSISWDKDKGGNKKIPVATPVYGKSALLRPLMRVDGLLVIDRETDKLESNAIAKVILFP